MWIPLALFEALTNSAINLLIKKQVSKIHPLISLFFNMCFVLFFMFVIIVLSGGFPHVTGKFFFFMFCSSILDSIAFIAGYWALKHTDISLLSPLGSLVPVFATIFAAVFLHEIPTPVKLIGILSIVIGAYVLNIADAKESFLKPMQKLFADKGVKMYFVQVILFGITPLFQKSAIFQTHPTRPLFASFIGYIFVTLYIGLYMMNKFTQHKKNIKENLWLFPLFGLLNAVAQFAAYTVLSLTYVGYATALFSLSSLLSVILGGILFKEKNIQERFLGAGIMVIGVVLLAL